MESKAGRLFCECSGWHEVIDGELRPADAPEIPDDPAAEDPTEDPKKPAPDPARVFSTGLIACVTAAAGIAAVLMYRKNQGRKETNGVVRTQNPANEESRVTEIRFF